MQLTTISTSNDPAADFALHQGWLRTVLVSRLGSHDEVEEVLQEVALAAANQSAKRATVDRVGPWLYRVALRQVLLMRRRQGRRRRLMTGAVDRLEGSDGCSQAVSPLDWLLSTERGELVQASLSTMTDRDRQLLLLKYVDGLSYEAIGQRLGVTASSVQSRLHRARKLLRNQLLKANVVDANAIANV